MYAHIKNQHRPYYEYLLTADGQYLYYRNPNGPWQRFHTWISAGIIDKNLVVKEYDSLEGFVEEHFSDLI
jgi:hypothetical protein